jgi:hypothetical protein
VNSDTEPETAYLQDIGLTEGMDHDRRRGRERRKCGKRPWNITEACRTSWNLAGTLWNIIEPYGTSWKSSVGKWSPY